MSKLPLIAPDPDSVIALLVVKETLFVPAAKAPVIAIEPVFEMVTAPVPVCEMPGDKLMALPGGNQ